jgi:hypothetical protein
LLVGCHIRPSSEVAEHEESLFVHVLIGKPASTFPEHAPKRRPALRQDRAPGVIGLKR